MFIVHTMEEIQGLIDAHNQFKATLGEADKEYNSIVSLVNEVETTVQKHQIPGGLANPYTTLTASVIFYFVTSFISPGQVKNLPNPPPQKKKTLFFLQIQPYQGAKHRLSARNGIIIFFGLGRF